MIKTAPAVFAVGNDYQIMFESEKPTLVSVKVGDEQYYDESNGIMNSLSSLHRVTVPMYLLNNEKKYTLHLRPLIERKPYFSTTEEPVELEFDFKPVPENNARAYHLSDTHNRIETPVKAARAFGNIDFLILNGDILDHSGDPSKFQNIYIICSEITKGNFPVVFSRGNHDLRGNYAERFADYTPNQNHNTYYTFRLGSIWGVLLDCGEDKSDTNDEYGFTVACHPFRLRQTEYLKSVIANADKEYNAKGVKTRLVISHNPFTEKLEYPFDIEKEIFTDWATLLDEYVKPHAIISGHYHKNFIRYPDSEGEYIKRPCPIVVGSVPSDDNFIGCGYIFGDNTIEVVFSDINGNVTEKAILNKKSIKNSSVLSNIKRFILTFKNLYATITSKLIN